MNKEIFLHQLRIRLTQLPPQESHTNDLIIMLSSSTIWSKTVSVKRLQLPVLAM